MLEKISPPKGAIKRRKRVGRGPGSQGKTSGKGHKGQNSRSGGGVSPWFEGGQTPLKMRVPKRGFTNIFRVTYDIVNVTALNRFNDGETITIDELTKSGLTSGKKPVKILGYGDLDKNITVKANRFSKSAVAKLEGRGGKAEVI